LFLNNPGFFFSNRCGNGLLVHILISEGYTGYGTDIRARTSWSHYPEPTQRSLHISPLNPTADSSDDDDDPPPDTTIPPGAFIIGNHADELTPWVPVLATARGASGYLNLPCCPWEFDQKFARSGACHQFPLPSLDFVDTLNLGGDGKNTSSYSMYRIWLARLSFHCGWTVEAEVLRIPSTRNWALVGK
jgi:tRNASer (uridine44-2'-O)-methyltransferase